MLETALLGLLNVTWLSFGASSGKKGHPLVKDFDTFALQARDSIYHKFVDEWSDTSNRLKDFVRGITKKLTQRNKNHPDIVRAVNTFSSSIIEYVQAMQAVRASTARAAPPLHAVDVAVMSCLCSRCVSQALRRVIRRNGGPSSRENAAAIHCAALCLCQGPRCRSNACVRAESCSLRGYVFMLSGPDCCVCSARHPCDNTLPNVHACRYRERTQWVKQQYASDLKRIRAVQEKLFEKARSLQKRTQQAEQAAKQAMAHATANAGPSEPPYCAKKSDHVKRMAVQGGGMIKELSADLARLQAEMEELRSEMAREKGARMAAESAARAANDRAREKEMLLEELRAKYACVFVCVCGGGGCGATSGTTVAAAPGCATGSESERLTRPTPHPWTNVVFASAEVLRSAAAAKHLKAREAELAEAKARTAELQEKWQAAESEVAARLKVINALKSKNRKLDGQYVAWSVTRCLARPCVCLSDRLCRLMLWTCGMLCDVVVVVDQRVWLARCGACVLRGAC